MINRWAVDNAKISSLSAQIIRKVFGNTPVASEEGKQRRLFASAITPDGMKNYLESIITTGKVYEIKGDAGTGTEILLDKVRNAALERGYYVESYYCALNPDKLEHLVIAGIDTSFTTSNGYHHVKMDNTIEINLNEYRDVSVMENYTKEIGFNSDMFDVLLNRAVATIYKAKITHDGMEQYYIPNMDFEAVQRCRESIMARVIDYAAE